MSLFSFWFLEEIFAEYRILDWHFTFVNEYNVITLYSGFYGQCWEVDSQFYCHPLNNNTTPPSWPHLILWLLLRFFLFLAFSSFTIICPRMIFLLLILLWFTELLEYVGWCLSSYQEILIFNHYFFKYYPSCFLLFIWDRQSMCMFIVSQIPLRFLFWFLLASLLAHLHCLMLCVICS